MDDHELRGAMVRLADPPRTKPTAHVAIVERVAAARRRRHVYEGIGLVAVLVAALMTIQLWPSGGAGTQATQSPHDVTLESGAYYLGVRLSMTVTFDTDRTLDAGHFTLAGDTYDGEFWTKETSGAPEPPDPLPVTAGEPVLVEAWAMPDCGVAPASEVTLTIASTVDGGGDAIDTFVASDLSAFDSAFEQWCSTPIYLNLDGSGVTTDGDARVSLAARNPGPNEVIVRTPAVSADGATWTATSTTVPPRQVIRIVILGAGVHCGTYSTLPWTDGNTTADGSPVSVQGSHDWC